MSLYYLLNPKFFSPMPGGEVAAPKYVKEERLEEPQEAQPRRKRTIKEMKKLLFKLLEAIDD